MSLGKLQKKVIFQISDKQEDLLTCLTCHRSFHAKCCQPPLENQMVFLESRFKDSIGNAMSVRFAKNAKVPKTNKSCSYVIVVIEPSILIV